MKIFKGDQYGLACVITKGVGDEEMTLTPEDVDDVEIVFGSLSKQYSTEGVTFADGKWIFNFTQQESFLFTELQPVVARVKISGNVYGVYLGTASIADVMTRVVL